MPTTWSVCLGMYRLGLLSTQYTLGGLKRNIPGLVMFKMFGFSSLRFKPGPVIVMLSTDLSSLCTSPGNTKSPGFEVIFIFEQFDDDETTNITYSRIARMLQMNYGKPCRVGCVPKCGEMLTEEKTFL